MPNGITGFKWLSATVSRVTWETDWANVGHEVQYRYKPVGGGPNDWYWIHTNDNIASNLTYDDFDWSTALPTDVEIAAVNVLYRPKSDGSWGMAGGDKWFASNNQYTVADLLPSLAPEPTLTVNKNTIKLEWVGVGDAWGSASGGGSISGSDMNIDEMQIVITEGTTTIKTEYSKLLAGTGTITYETTLEYGKHYKVAYRGINKVVRDANGNVTSFTGPSTDTNYFGTTPVDVYTAPAAPTNVTWNQTTVVQGTTNYIKVYWDHDDSCQYHIVKYIDSESGNFDINSTVSINQSSGTNDYIELELSGGKYTMQVIGVNAGGEGLPTTINVSLGIPPQKPSVWTDLNQYLVGRDTPVIYWQHYSVDGSRMYMAEVEIRYGNRGSATFNVDYTNREPINWKKNGSFVVPDTFVESTADGPITHSIRSSERVYYRVRTAGANGKYGEWSNEQYYMRYITPHSETWLYEGATETYPNTPDAGTALTISSLPMTVFTNIWEVEKPYSTNPQYEWHPLQEARPILNTNGIITLFYNFTTNPRTEAWWFGTEAIENIKPGTNVKMVEALQPYDVHNCTIWILESDSEEYGFTLSYNVTGDNLSGRELLEEYPLTKAYFKIVVMVGDGQSSIWKTTVNSMRSMFKLRQKTTPFASQKVREISYRLVSVSERPSHYDDTGMLKPLPRESTLWSWTGKPTEDRYWIYKTIYSTDLDITMSPGQLHTLYITTTFESGMQITESKSFMWNGGYNEQAPGGPITIRYTDDSANNDDDKCTMTIGFKWPSNMNYMQAIKYECYVYRRNADGTYTLIEDHIRLGAEGSAQDYRGTKYCFVKDYHPFIGENTYIIGTRYRPTGDTYTIKVSKEVKSDFPIIDFKEHWLPLNGSTYKERVLISKIYNITINENNSVDKEDILFAGRTRKNSYYGMSQTEEQAWSFEFPRDDKETLYQLRMLSLHKGSVYVREVNGRGYWADIDVSINDTYNTQISTGTFKITITGGINEP